MFVLTFFIIHAICYNISYYSAKENSIKINRMMKKKCESNIENFEPKPSKFKSSDFEYADKILDKRIRVYCISRLKRKDYLKAFLDELKKKIYYTSFDIERIKAIDPDNLIMANYQTSLSSNELSRYLSHVQCMMTFLSTLETTPYAIVFEDDIICSDDFNNIINLYDNDYDLLIINNGSDIGLKTVDKQKPSTTSSPNLVVEENENSSEIQCIQDEKLKEFICREFTSIYSADAYIINKKAANAILANAFPINKPFNTYFSDPSIYKDLKIGVLAKSKCDTKINMDERKQREEDRREAKRQAIDDEIKREGERIKKIK